MYYAPNEWPTPVYKTALILVTTANQSTSHASKPVYSFWLVSGQKSASTDYDGNGMSEISQHFQKIVWAFLWGDRFYTRGTKLNTKGQQPQKTFKS